VFAHDYNELWQAGRRAWPAIELNQAMFTAFLAERGVAGSSNLASDLYLACACSAANPAALAAFDTRHASDITGALSNMRLSAELVDEVRQRVRTKLFLRTGDEPARIARYTGRGSLAGWLKVVAVRTAVDILREERSAEVPGEDSLLEVFADDAAGPEMAALKERYRADVNDAFARAFAALSARQRNLLRQHYLHELNIDRIGALYGVHRATAFRWITQAKLDVLHGARREVERVVGGDPEAAQQLVEILRSQVDLSLDRLLRTAA
jgi:RNA polymerase sigma-70 factor (ECF subfamily)